MVGYSLSNSYPGPPEPVAVGSPHCSTDRPPLVIRWQTVLSKYPPCARLAKLFTVQGALALSKTSPMLPWLVFMLAVSVAGSVGIFPVRGICFSMVLEALPAGRY
ncbi:Uncharacterised protein [Mycobacteroides abscessus]|nr:Uncharacterised protein [Mycobacteroides abscessus]SKW33975.1 Uncharacterised protein [Mycobacteroides abscessus subsp. abscessus]SPX75651.1 Uncharacterised protein [Mycobacteroides abscessus]